MIPYALDHLCIIVFGSVKLTSTDFKIVLGEGQLFGEQALFNLILSAQVHALEETCILSLPLLFYRLLRKESILNGLKGEFSKL